MNTMTIPADESRESSARLKRELKIADAKKRAMALALIAPLAIFLFLIFVVPIGALLTRAIAESRSGERVAAHRRRAREMGPQGAAIG